MYKNQINWDCDEHFDYNKTLSETVDTDQYSGESYAGDRENMMRGRSGYVAEEEEEEVEDEEDRQRGTSSSSQVEESEISVDGGYKGVLRSDSGSGIKGRRRRRNSDADDDLISTKAVRERKKGRTGRRNRYRGNKGKFGMDVESSVDVHEGRRGFTVGEETDGQESIDKDEDRDEEGEDEEEEALEERTRRNRNKRKIGGRSSRGRRRRRRRGDQNGLESDSGHDNESPRSSKKRRRAKIGGNDDQDIQYDDEHVNDDDNRHGAEILDNDSDGDQTHEIRRKSEQPSSRKRPNQHDEVEEAELDDNIDSKLSVLYLRYSHESLKAMTGNFISSKNQIKSLEDDNKKELRLLAMKGMTAEALKTSLDRMIVNWVQRSVDPRIDYLIAIALLFVHIEERATCISILREVCGLYREIGFFTLSTGGSSSKYSEVGISSVALEHRWAADVKVSSGDTCPLSRALAGKQRDCQREREKECIELERNVEDGEGGRERERECVCVREIGERVCVCV